MAGVAVSQALSQPGGKRRPGRPRKYPLRSKGGAILVGV
jgi:hypothetical protein